MVNTMETELPSRRDGTALAVDPGLVVSREALLAALPTGAAGVRAFVKRGCRLAAEQAGAGVLAGDSR